MSVKLNVSVLQGKKQKYIKQTNQDKKKQFKAAKQQSLVKTIYIYFLREQLNYIVNLAFGIHLAAWKKERHFINYLRLYTG